MFVTLAKKCNILLYPKKTQGHFDLNGFVTKNKSEKASRRIIYGFVDQHLLCNKYVEVVCLWCGPWSHSFFPSRSFIFPFRNVRTQLANLDMSRTSKKLARLRSLQLLFLISGAINSNKIELVIDRVMLNEFHRKCSMLLLSSVLREYRNARRPEPSNKLCSNHL